MKNYAQLILVGITLLMLSLVGEWLDEKSSDSSHLLFNK
ncbi:hypothetical protein C8J95_104110 [Elizabethkingia sp. YR214]|nr:hypothetical protein C8J95_104110 [Elizabethkingia sp. YR214]